jgi:hypothetical protein
VTSPAGTPTLSVATDQPTYNVGDAITVTVTYADSTVTSTTLTVTANFTDQAGNAASATTTAQVNTSQTGAMDGTVTDSFGGTYTESSNDQVGTAVFTGTVGTPPAG